MTKTEKLAAELLRAVRRERDRLRVIDPTPFARSEWKLRAAVADAKAGVVAANFTELLGRALTSAESRACQRAAERLEAAGKLRRLRLGYDGSRLTHFQLIEAPAPDTATNE